MAARTLGATPGQVSAAPAGAVLGGSGQLVTLVPATVLVVAALTAGPVRLGARRPVTDTL